MLLRSHARTQPSHVEKSSDVTCESAGFCQSLAIVHILGYKLVGDKE